MSELFDPNSSQWTLVFCNGGMNATLQACLEKLFSPADYSGSQRVGLELYTEFKNNCLMHGYASINGWTVYYDTVEGESSFNRSAITSKP